MGFKLSKHGFTSWGLPYRLVFGAGMVLADKRGIAKVGITFEDDKIVEHLIDNRFRLTPMQRKEVMDIASEFYAHNQETIKRAMDIITPLALACLSEHNVPFDKIPDFINSKTYTGIVQRSMQTIRESMYLDNPDDDWIFSRMGDGERSGPIYTAVDARLVSILLHLATNGEHDI